MYKKNNRHNLNLINQELTTYLWPGYDLFFVHGWFIAYLSSPSDSEEDMLIPSYLILDESKINDEQQFSQLVDKLVDIYSSLADSIYEQNKLIRPLVNFDKPNSFDPLTFSNIELRNLVNWLYGYLTGYLAIGVDITDFASDEALLENKFFPALFTLCVAFFKLSEHYDWHNIDHKVIKDFDELKSDLMAMWEAESHDESIEDTFKEAMNKLDLNDIIGALNDVFYVVRLCDENSNNHNKLQASLLGKLILKQ